jgi:hypothetical protein
LHLVTHRVHGELVFTVDEFNDRTAWLEGERGREDAAAVRERAEGELHEVLHVVTVKIGIILRIKAGQAVLVEPDINCKEFAFAPAAPEMVRTGTGVGE